MLNRHFKFISFTHWVNHSTEEKKKKTEKFVAVACAHFQLFTVCFYRYFCVFGQNYGLMIELNLQGNEIIFDSHTNNNLYLTDTVLWIKVRKRFVLHPDSFVKWLNLTYKQYYIQNDEKMKQTRREKKTIFIYLYLLFWCHDFGFQL